MNDVPAETRRPYRQSARAMTAEATGRRILDAFQARLHSGWLEEIRLEDVARDAEVTVQTVIRRFGGKEGLFEAVIGRLDREIRVRREAPPGDAEGAVRGVVEDYEVSGDLVLRILAQEDRLPAIRRFADHGRAEHRRWIATAFEPWLAGLSPQTSRRCLDELVVALDVYVWKLFRRDMGRTPAEVEALMRRLVAAILPSSPRIPELLDDHS